MENIDIYIPLFDSAYEYLSQSGHLKLGLFQSDPNTKDLLIENGESQTFKVYPLDKVGVFTVENFENCITLKSLPNLRLETREAYIQHVSIDVSKKPVFLVNVCFFMDGTIPFREGMTDIYGIEKIQTTDGEKNLGRSNFPPRREYQTLGQHNNDLFTQLLNENRIESVHNKLLSIILFRSRYNEGFEKTLHQSKGQERIGKFCLNNITPILASSLFKFIHEKYMSYDINLKVNAYQRIPNKRDRIHSIDMDDISIKRISISKVTQTYDPQQGFSISVPFTEFMVGFLSKHFSYYPGKTYLTRVNTPSLETVRFDHIPSSNSNLKIEWNSLTEELQTSFTICQSFYKNICSQPTFKSMYTNYKQLEKRIFKDEELKTCVVIIQVEYNTELFFAKVGKKKNSIGYFVAWGVPSDLFFKYNRVDFEDKCFRETKGLCIPYDPTNLDTDSMTVKFLTEEDREIHHEVIRPFFNRGTPEIKPLTSTKKRGASTSVSCSSVKKRLYSKEYELTPPSNKIPIKRERSTFIKEKAKQENDEVCYKNHLKNFVSIAETFLSNFLESKQVEESVDALVSTEAVIITETIENQLSPQTSVETVESSSASPSYYSRNGVLYLVDNLKLGIKEDEFIDSGRLSVLLENVIHTFQAKDIRSIIALVFPAIAAQLQNKKTLSQITTSVIDFIKSLEL